MFILKLKDRKGNILNIGDIVKISNGRNFTFYSEIKYLPDEKVITPFHTFSFHSFEKVDKVPNEAILTSEKRYKIWFLSNPEKDQDASSGERYLIDWRQCEHLLDERCFEIELINKQKILF